MTQTNGYAGTGSTDRAATPERIVTRRAMLLDGSYVEIIPKAGGWTYDHGTDAPSDEVPDIYTTPDEAEAFARNRFEAELVTEFSEDGNVQQEPGA